MAIKKQEWPEIGDLVIATVETVTDYGAYVKLDEYDKKGLLHISEISSSWIRNIRDFVREGQKIVLKVLRVDIEKGHVDLSLRRVTKREKIEKIMFQKKERIHVPMVKVKGIVELRCAKPNGVKIIKEAFLTAKKAEKSRDAKLRFYVVAAPKYCIEVLAENYKRAEDILQKVAQNIVSNIVKAGGQGSFKREK